VSAPFEADASVVLRQNHGAEEPCDVALPLRTFLGVEKREIT
jgi:hypothetical protein